MRRKCERQPWAGAGALEAWALHNGDTAEPQRRLSDTTRRSIKQGVRHHMPKPPFRRRIGR